MTKLDFCMQSPICVAKTREKSCAELKHLIFSFNGLAETADGGMRLRVDKSFLTVQHMELRIRNAFLY